MTTTSRSVYLFISVLSGCMVAVLIADRLYIMLGGRKRRIRTGPRESDSTLPQPTAVRHEFANDTLLANLNPPVPDLLLPRVDVTERRCRCMAGSFGGNPTMCHPSPTHIRSRYNILYYMSTLYRITQNRNVTAYGALGGCSMLSDLITMCCYAVNMSGTRC